MDQCRSIYKIKHGAIIDDKSSVGSNISALSELDRLKCEIPNKFSKINIKQRSYLGRDAIVIYFKSISYKVRSKIIEQKQRELIQERMQAESYKSTISHELRTPLENIMQVIQMLLSMLTAKGKKLSSHDLKKACQSLNLAHGQLALMGCFVEDLLSLRLLREGHFQI